LRAATVRTPGANAFSRNGPQAEVGRPVLHDQEVGGREDGREIGVRPGEPQLHFQGPGRPRLDDLVGDALHLRAERRLLVAQQRIDNVVGGEAGAVVELHALAQAERPGRAVRGLDGFRKRRLRRQPFVELCEPAVEHVVADIVSRQRALRGIQRVGRGAGDSRYADAAAPARRSGGPGLLRRDRLAAARSATDESEAGA
jgi:hypothetical protein